MHKVHAEFVSPVYIEERCLLPNEVSDKALLFVMQSVILSLTIVLKVLLSTVLPTLSMARR